MPTAPVVWFGRAPLRQCHVDRRGAVEEGSSSEEEGAVAATGREEEGAAATVFEGLTAIAGIASASSPPVASEARSTGKKKASVGEWMAAQAAAAADTGSSASVAVTGAAASVAAPAGDTAGAAASGAASAAAPAGDSASGEATEAAIAAADRLAAAVRSLRSQVFAMVVACFDLDAQVTALWSLQWQGAEAIDIVEMLGNSLEATFARTVMA
ncbi:MAG: hypothetical protein GY772_15825 [bacterium]|nr:hypothetical protein [bacterium]